MKQNDISCQCSNPGFIVISLPTELAVLVMTPALPGVNISQSNQKKYRSVEQKIADKIKI